MPKKKFHLRNSKKVFFLEFKKPLKRFGLNTKNKELKSLKLRLVNLARKEIANTGLDPHILQVLLGGCLGDGSIGMFGASKNARATVKHSTIQLQYFYHKVDVLKPLCSKKGVQLVSPTQTSYSKNNKMQLQTLVHPGITKLFRIMYTSKKDPKLKSGVKHVLKIRRRWLNALDPRGLMIWWLDDGSLQCGWRQGIFCCEGFSLKSQQILVKYLKQVWGIEARIVSHIIKHNDPTSPLFNTNTQAYRIKLGTTELKKFLKIIMPFIPTEDVIYKVCIRYKDSKLQQRWISDLLEALPQFESVILNHYKTKYNFDYIF